MDKTKNKDFIENKPEEDKEYALEFTMVGDKRTEVSEEMSLSRESILILVRLWRKLFQVGKKELQGRLRW